MIEPYSLNANWSCKLKRYHKLIFEMWENYATYKEIVDKLAEIGCRTCTQSVCTYVTRCLLEEGEPHVFERRKPIEFNGRKAWAKLLDRHEEIINLRYYQGYTLNEIAKIMEVAQIRLSVLEKQIVEQEHRIDKAMKVYTALLQDMQRCCQKNIH